MARLKKVDKMSTPSGSGVEGEAEVPDVEEVIPPWPQRLLKLFFILACYSYLFHTLIVNGRWFLKTQTDGSNGMHLFDWIKCLPGCDPRAVGFALINDALLFLIFILQHSLCTERNLEGTFIHRKIFVEWKINGALYTLSTAMALNVMMFGWKTVPIYIWHVRALKSFVYYSHIFAWVTLYGSSLMHDMPGLIGFDQVVITNVSTSTKSENFKSMLQNQRHMGLVQFTIVTVVCHVMTLDRLLYLVIFLVYACTKWRSHEDFPYIKAMVDDKRAVLTPTTLRTMKTNSKTTKQN